MLLAATDKITADDPRRFSIALNQPFPLMLDVLGKPNAPVPFMMPARIMQAAGAGRITEIVGSGPFVFRPNQWRAGDSMVLAQNIKQAGFTVDEQLMDWGTVLSRRGKREGWSLFPVYSNGADMESPLTHFYITNNCADYPGWSCAGTCGSRPEPLRQRPEGRLGGGQRVVDVGLGYGMVVLSDHPQAARFALFVMSEAGQALLQRHGFDPVGVAAP